MDNKSSCSETLSRQHPSLQFVIETTDDKNKLPFTDMSVNVEQEGTIFCTWYQKPSDTRTILHYRSCAPLQLRKDIIQGTTHHLFQCISNLEAFYEALTKIGKI